MGSFDVVREQLSWPWVSIDSSGNRFAFASSREGIASRGLEHGRVVDEATFPLPADLSVPTEPAKQEATRDVREGLHAFAVAPHGRSLAATGIAGGVSVVATLVVDGERRRSSLDALAGPGFVAQALTFDRSGGRVWVAAESESETALLAIDPESHALLGIVKSPPFPPPATYELFVHPHEDAVLLLAACGPDGTFARVTRVVDGGLKAVWTSLDGGGISAGMVGFSPDGSRVYLAEADELRTHAWPGLKELSSIPFDDDFVSSYSGAVIGEHVLVDGQDYETKEDAVTRFDLELAKGRLLLPPVPTGMWIGRLGVDMLVTVEAKGDPSRGRVIRTERG